jgi:hypothetical protein
MPPPPNALLIANSDPYTTPPSLLSGDNTPPFLLSLRRCVSRSDYQVALTPDVSICTEVLCYFLSAIASQSVW